MKTYFNYNQVISSKEAAEAIAMVKGNGPIIGFGSATIESNSNEIKITPLPSENDPMYNIMLGKKDRWNIVNQRLTLISVANFFCIIQDCIGSVIVIPDSKIVCSVCGNSFRILTGIIFYLLIQ